jgi:hydroxymethylpyrimidine pyrophosphatase-like HAD family hydrolase
MCFGDYINDYSMFQECDIKVAMDNGTEKLKQLADYVTLTNDTDGVAAFLEETLL